jgi:hypothetical protein
VTGDYPPPGDHGGSDAAYQVDAIGLVEIVSALNGGTDRAGKIAGRAHVLLHRRGCQSDRR